LTLIQGFYYKDTGVSNIYVVVSGELPSTSVKSQMLVSEMHQRTSCQSGLRVWIKKVDRGLFGW